MQPSRQARLSDQIIAVSLSTKADLATHYHIDPARITIVHNAASIERPTEAALQDFIEKNHLPNRYIFSLGTLEPRKNIVGLVRAFNLIKSRPGFEDVHLIIGGTRGWKYDPVFSEINRSPYHKDIHYEGYISHNRAAYYALASVFAYPSFFEGFGIPVLEAMACGTPVVTSANSSMPEVAGSAGVLVDPYNISAIAQGLQSVLENKELADTLRMRSRAQASIFDWETSAQKTLEIIHRG
jgi:glycosyltransferase involved in cell wall biosynthesis